jgi:hypothetical protein
MNWQDGLALLVVAIAALALLRRVPPTGMVRFGTRRAGDGSVETAPPAGGCGGCASGSSCFKGQVKVYPVAVGRRERSFRPSSNPLSVPSPPAKEESEARGRLRPPTSLPQAGEGNT